MKTFEFQGEIDSSKSHYNRALILKSYKPDLVLEGHSNSRDVVFLKKALESHGPEFEVGEGGTTLRFLAFRLSRLPGIWRLKGSRRLLSRPQTEISKILKQLDVHVEVREDHLEIHSRGWNPSGEIHVDLSESSQFASGLLLNAWNLPFELNVVFSEKRVSDGYLEMTLQLLEQAGLQFQRSAKGVLIAPDQSIQIQHLKIEPDVSSAFVVAALAAARGRCRIQNFPKKSLQPDSMFVDLFQKMQIPIRFEGDALIVDKAESIHPLQISLNSAPDLFPVLAVLLTRAEGESLITDTPQLVFKESNRLQKIADLLKLMGVSFDLLPDGMKIRGPVKPHGHFFDYDSDQDHRLAFAGALAKEMGYQVRVLHPEVVDKSFPGFWNLISGGPG